MEISGYVKATCRVCKKSVDWYLSSMPSANTELVYTCGKCNENIHVDKTYG